MTISMLDNQFQNLDDSQLDTATGGKNWLHKVGGAIAGGARKLGNSSEAILADAGAGAALGSLAGPEAAPAGAVAGAVIGAGNALLK